MLNMTVGGRFLLKSNDFFSFITSQAKALFKDSTLLQLAY